MSGVFQPDEAARPSAFQVRHLGRFPETPYREELESDNHVPSRAAPVIYGVGETRDVQMPKEVLREYRMKTLAETLARARKSIFGRANDRYKREQKKENPDPLYTADTAISEIAPAFHAARRAGDKDAEIAALVEYDQEMDRKAIATHYKGVTNAEEKAERELERQRRVQEKEIEERDAEAARQARAALTAANRAELEAQRARGEAIRAAAAANKAEQAARSEQWDQVKFLAAAKRAKKEYAQERLDPAHPEHAEYMAHIARAVAHRKAKKEAKEAKEDEAKLLRQRKLDDINRDIDENLPGISSEARAFVVATMLESRVPVSAAAAYEKWGSAVSRVVQKKAAERQLEENMDMLADLAVSLPMGSIGDLHASLPPHRGYTSVPSSPYRTPSSPYDRPPQSPGSFYTGEQ